MSLSTVLVVVTGLPVSSLEREPWAYKYIYIYINRHVLMVLQPAVHSRRARAQQSVGPAPIHLPAWMVDKVWSIGKWNPHRFIGGANIHTTPTCHPHQPVKQTTITKRNSNPPSAAIDRSTQTQRRTDVLEVGCWGIYFFIFLYIVRSAVGWCGWLEEPLSHTHACTHARSHGVVGRTASHHPTATTRDHPHQTCVSPKRRSSSLVIFL